MLQNGYKVNEVTEDITGRLEDWWLDKSTFSPSVVARGALFEDTRGRWDTGKVIRTSVLVGDDFSSVREGDIIRTLNSKYLLGKRRENGS